MKDHTAQPKHSTLIKLEQVTWFEKQFFFLTFLSVTPGKRVKVIGVSANLTPMHATLIGSRTNWTLPSNPEQVTNASAFGGNKLFDIRAKSWEMSFINFVNVGFVFAFNVDVNDILLENIKCYNVRSFFDQDASVTLTDITIRNVNISYFCDFSIFYLHITE